MRREVSHPPGLQFAKFLPLQTGQSCAAAFLTIDSTPISNIHG